MNENKMDNSFFKSEGDQCLKIPKYIKTSEDELDEYILQIMNETKAVGLVCLFLKDQKVIWKKAYGWSDLTEKIRMGTDSIFKIYSISKALFSTAFMKLYEDGLIELDEDISKYLGFKIRNPKFPKKAITIRMLLTHTSSLTDGDLGEDETIHNIEPAGYGKALSSENPPILERLFDKNDEYYSENAFKDYEPGSGNFFYSNFGVGILACILERITKQYFDVYCEKNLFKPLNMNTSYFYKNVTGPISKSYNYNINGDNFNESSLYYPFGDGDFKYYRLPLGNNYIGPAGSIYTDIESLSKFMQMHLNGGSSNNIRILKPSTTDLMHKVQWEGYGLDGFYRKKGLLFHITDKLIDEILVGHTGYGNGFLGNLYFNKVKNSGVIFLSNGSNDIDVDSGFSYFDSKIISKLFEVFNDN